MEKKIMQDMKSKGVKITRISRNDINSDRTFSDSIQPKSTEEYLLKIEEGVKSERNSNDRVRSEKISILPRAQKRKRSVRKSVLLIFILSILAGSFYFIANKFESTHIVIKEKTQTLAINKEPLNAFNEKDAPINFEIMITPQEEFKEIILTDPQEVSLKAHGVVTLYNENSIKSQKLLTKTFLSDEAGKSYQTDEEVVIPGYALDESKTIIPGQIDIGITSFLPGSTYNGNPTNFTINGFKGTTKAIKIYAKLKTPLSGGAEGMVYKPSSQDTAVLNAYALSTFKSNLLKKVNAQVPPGYILYGGAMNMTSSVEDNILSQTPKYQAKIIGIATAIIIKEKDLSKALIKKLLPNLTLKELDEVAINDLSGLTFNFLNGGQEISKDLKSVSFTLSGDINPIWHHDVEILKKSLIGVPKSDLQSIFELDPGIISATAKIFPPWNKYLPKEISKIHITLD